jgi:threonine/homoserine/homoserine lactone efflux protein
MSFKPVLDFLRANFAYIVAFALPLAGIVMAIAKAADGDRDDALRIAAAAVLGGCVYALLLL